MQPFVSISSARHNVGCAAHMVPSQCAPAPRVGDGGVETVSAAGLLKQRAEIATLQQRCGRILPNAEVRALRVQAALLQRLPDLLRDTPHRRL